MEYLEGGRHEQISLSENVVRRPAGPWTETIHNLLHHLKKAGFDGAPAAIGIDDDGNEMVSFIPGEVSNYPLSTAASSPEALMSAALLLRKYHDATVPFADDEADDAVWMLPKREPGEVICHGDYAPYNVVLSGNQAIGIIDFDTAHPAPRIWDVAYAVYRWVPFVNPNSPDTIYGLAEQIKRAKQFCDGYGLDVSQRKMLVDTLIERLDALVRYMRAEADKGNDNFIANIADGHDLAYLEDIEYLRAHKVEITSGLR